MRRSRRRVAPTGAPRDDVPRSSGGGHLQDLQDRLQDRGGSSGVTQTQGTLHGSDVDRRSTS